MKNNTMSRCMAQSVPNEDGNGTVRSILEQFRRCNDALEDCDSNSYTGSVRQFVELYSGMIRDLGVRKACLEQNQLLYMQLPLSLHVFYFRFIDGTVCRVGPYMTAPITRQTLGYWLRGSAVNVTEEIYAFIKATPMRTQEQIQEISRLLSSTLERDTMLIDARNYCVRGKNTSGVYELASHYELRQRTENAAEKAEHFISQIFLYFRSGNRKAMDATVEDFDSLFLQCEKDYEVLCILRVYLEEEVAEIISAQFGQTRSRDSILLLSSTMERICRQTSAQGLIQVQHDFLNEAFEMAWNPVITDPIIDRRIEDIKAYIRVHYAEKLTLKDLADRANLSTTYLSGLFSHEAGQTISTFIRQTRIDHAQLLLHYMSLPVTDIAYQCGYQDISYFIKEFRKETGCSPAQYRRNWYRNHEEPKSLAI